MKRLVCNISFKFERDSFEIDCIVPNVLNQLRRVSYNLNFR